MSGLLTAPGPMPVRLGSFALATSTPTFSFSSSFSLTHLDSPRLHRLHWAYTILTHSLRESRESSILSTLSAIPSNSSNSPRAPFYSRVSVSFPTSPKKIYIPIHIQPSVKENVVVSCWSAISRQLASCFAQLWTKCPQSEQRIPIPEHRRQCRCRWATEYFSEDVE